MTTGCVLMIQWYLMVKCKQEELMEELVGVKEAGELNVI